MMSRLDKKEVSRLQFWTFVYGKINKEVKVATWRDFVESLIIWVEKYRALYDVSRKEYTTVQSLNPNLRYLCW